MDALFVPITVLLLVAFGAVFLHAFAGDRFERIDLTPIAVVAGLCALILGIALLAGEPLAHDYDYLQALGPAVGVSLLVYALARSRSVSRHALGAAVFVAIAVALVSLFWATPTARTTAGARRRGNSRATSWFVPPWRSSARRTSTSTRSAPAGE